MMLYSKNSKYNKLTWLFSNLTIQVCPDEKAANMVNHTLKGWKKGIQGQLLNIHILSVCLFLPVCGGYVHAHVYRCEWRPEVNNGCLPQLLSLLFLRESLLLNMELLVWLASKPQRPSSLCFPKYCNHECTSTFFFFLNVGATAQTQILTVVEQALH